MFCQYCSEWSDWSTVTVTVAVTGSSVATTTTLPAGGRAVCRAKDPPVFVGSERAEAEETGHQHCWKRSERQRNDFKLLRNHQ